MTNAKARRHPERPGFEVRPIDRQTARAYEQNLEPGKRKQLGQFFTGVPLGRLLAHIALREDFRTVLDPMAGHGDLLVATRESASARGIPIDRLDGIEVDGATAAVCRDRLAAHVPDSSHLGSYVLTADAFDPASPAALPARGYDLVITNPPYVRYQARSRNRDTKLDPVREGLSQIVRSRCTDADKSIWKALSQNYSGLADLSVPAWILAALLVRPGGRLAMVAPATWRSRDYADVIRYMLLRCFAMEAVVADTQPGWFSDALVRTHLVIARRLSSVETKQPLVARKAWPNTRWIRIAPDAANEDSLVGATFGNRCPEAVFAASINAKTPTARRGIEDQAFDLPREWASLSARINHLRWYTELEEDGRNRSQFCTPRQSTPAAIPSVLQNLLPSNTDTTALVPLEKARIKVGQGLRTGCNGFFYVTAGSSAEDGLVCVKASSTFGDTEVPVPPNALRPALRRQAEMPFIERCEDPPSLILDLRSWILPEEASIVAAAQAAYVHRGVEPPQIMPPKLAAHVRRATVTSAGQSGNAKPIPELSAVRTNVRLSAREGVTPRFWYMLPDFTARHLPDTFVPRVNQGTPWIECNLEPPLLIDANFSTFWAPDGHWSRFALKALLNSVWCRAYMEATGTPLGGGALKLEATHLRQMLVPDIGQEGRAALATAGKRLSRNNAEVQAQIDHIILQILSPSLATKADTLNLASRIAHRTQSLCAARQRQTP